MKQKEILVSKQTDIPYAEEYPIIIRDNETDYKAIINPDTNNTFAIVSKDYQLVPHRDVYEQIMNSDKFEIKRSAVYKKGRTLMIEIVPTETEKIELIPDTKDYVEPRARIFNSYDTTKALSVEGYGMRLVCSNGMIAPGFTSRYRKTHSFTNIDINDINRNIELALNTWTTSAEQLQYANTKKVDVAYTLALSKFPKRYLKPANELLLGKQTETVYNIWNALTNVVTHIVDDNVQTGTLVSYQKKANNVFKALNDPRAEPKLSSELPKLED